MVEEFLERSVVLDNGVDLRRNLLDHEIQPHRQSHEPAAFVPYTVVAPPARTLALRTQGKPLLLLNAVRQQVRAIDKDQPVGRPLTRTYATPLPASKTDPATFVTAVGLVARSM